MSSTFAELGVSADLVACLAERGITTPFPVQSLTIPDGLAGRDVCGKARTGSGKTLAFGIPLVTRVSEGGPSAPTALVLVPTRELAQQVCDELAPLATATGRRMEVVYGGADLDRQSRRLRAGVDAIVATPGRLIDFVDRGDVSLTNVEMVVLDEADRMADMGFLPQVEWLLRHVGGRHQTMLFSATLDAQVRRLVSTYQHDPVFHEVVSDSPTVDDMEHRFLKVHEMDKVKVAATIASSVDRCLIFCGTKRGADHLVRDLRKEGVDAMPIHGDLRQQHREKALSSFAEGELRVLVATDVAARGIHVDQIDVVIHWDPPTDHKTYLHRSGRTARAGASGVVATLVLWNEELEVRRLQRRLELDIPIVEVFSNDDRLADLASWDPSSEAVA